MPLSARARPAVDGSPAPHQWLSPRSDLALVKGMGGAMDLVSGVGRVLVVIDHVTNQGEPKLLASCTHR